MSIHSRRVSSHEDDVPKYRARPNSEKLLVRKILALILLGIVLYVSIFINYYIISSKIPQVLNWLFITGIVLLLILEAILKYVQYNNYSYDFHVHKLVIRKGKIQVINYSDIVEVKYSTSLLDKLMHTGSVILKLKDGIKIKIDHLNNFNQALMYLQKNIKHS